jgi:hypothetical protein
MVKLEKIRPCTKQYQKRYQNRIWPEERIKFPSAILLVFEQPEKVVLTHNVIPISGRWDHNKGLFFLESQGGTDISRGILDFGIKGSKGLDRFNDYLRLSIFFAVSKSSAGKHVIHIRILRLPTLDETSRWPQLQQEWNMGKMNGLTNNVMEESGQSAFPGSFAFDLGLGVRIVTGYEEEFFYDERGAFAGVCHIRFDKDPLQSDSRPVLVTGDIPSGLV